MNDTESEAVYRAALQRYLRGEITGDELAAADPYDRALRRMAMAAAHLDHHFETVSERRLVMQDFFKRVTLPGVIVGFVVGALLMVAAGTLRPPA